MSAYNYDQPSNSTALTTTSSFDIVPAPDVLEREVQSLIGLNVADNTQMTVEVWLDEISTSTRKLLLRRSINPGGRFELVDADQYILDTDHKISINLVEATSEKWLAVSAIWRDKWEYHTVPNLLDYWVHDEGVSTVNASDGKRVERWTGQFAGLTLDNLLALGQQPLLNESGGLNSNGYIQFAAARNDYLACAFGGTEAQPLTIGIVYDWGGATGDFLFDAVDVTNRAYLSQNGTDMEIFCGGTAETEANDTTFRSLHTLVAVLDGTSSKMYWEGGANRLAATLLGTNGMAGITLGGDYQQTASAASDLNIYELMIVNTATLSDALVNRWGREMGAKYRRPWTAVS